MIPLEQALGRLGAGARAVEALVGAVPDAQARWKPAPGEWSVLEVLGHLLDEEREDFRARVDLTLHRPGERWPPIAPERWAAERGYNQRAWPAALQAFLEERRRSVAWLRGLAQPDWTATHHHPRLGPMRAGDLLGAWVAHDHLHLRQLTQLSWQWLGRDVAPPALDYVGGW